MREPSNTTAAVIDVNGVKLALKARPDNSDMNPSGWSIIAFAPSASIRCIRGHQPKHMELFIRSIMTLAGVAVSLDEFWQPSEQASFDEIKKAVHRITDHTFE